MSQLGVFLARQELRVVFDNFDQNKDGNIAYSEFVNVLKVSYTTNQKGLMTLSTLHQYEILTLRIMAEPAIQLFWYYADKWTILAFFDF